LIAALVDGLLTTFVYDGDGHRLQLSVAGEVITYTLDYAGGFRVLLEEGGAFSDTKHYLYGLACIGEQVDADEVDSEWRFYQRDGNSLVRQTTNMQATVTLAWTYSPEGAVLLGEEGPVTNLDCTGNTIYDFSTGLIFKNGKYFDPNTGIWVTMGGLVVYHGGGLPHGGRRRKWGKGKKRLILLSMLLLLALLLGGCIDGDPTPVLDPIQAPTSTPCPTPTLLPPPIIEQPFINTPPPTITPIPPTITNTPTPVNTPILPTPTSTPYPGVPIPTVSVFEGDSVSWPPATSFSRDDHPGIDIVPSSKNGGGDEAAGAAVVALHSGYVYNGPDYGGSYEIFVKEDLNNAYEIGYSHVEPNSTTQGAGGKKIVAGTVIGTLVSPEKDPNIIAGLAHLHLSLKVPAGTDNYVDPSFLIPQWGT
jgi:hypothetical protein